MLGRPDRHGMVWPGGHEMDIWYGLEGMAWYMVWPGGHGRIYDMARQARHGIWYGLLGMELFMVWPGGHVMVFFMAWEGMA